MAIRPRFSGGIGAWAKAQKVPITSTQNTTYSGEKYDFDRFPVVASLMFGFFEHPTARELFVAKSVQTAFTTVAFFACAWQLTEGDPGNIIYVMHTRDAARDKMKDVMNPIFSAIPALRTGERLNLVGADAESTAEAMRFSGGTLYVGGGQSASILTSTPARIVLLDEAERHAFMGKSTTFELARGRMTGANDGKLVAFSKPEQMSTWSMDARTGQWKVEPRLLSLMDAEWVSGDQREFHCPCPHCQAWHPIHWENIHYRHLNEALPGMKQALWNWDRFEKEVYWQCPTCAGRVHEGPEKHAMILAGSRAPLDQCWPPAPLEHRREKGAKPRAEPHKWSATVSALTDIAFSYITWGKLAIRWINAQGDSTKIVNFINEVLGKPERPLAAEDTTIEHLRKLIPSTPPRPNSQDPLPWKYRQEDGTPTFQIPLLAAQLGGQFDHDTLTWGPVRDQSLRCDLCIGMTVDRQSGKKDESGYLPYRVRAYHYDGRSFLLDQGSFPYHEQGDFTALVEYMQSAQFRTLDDQWFGIDVVWIDLGGDDVPDAYDLCYDYGEGNVPRLEGVRGIGIGANGRMPVESEGKNLWIGTRKDSPKPVHYWKSNGQYWEKYLYETVIQRFTPARHRPWAPALYFPIDIEEDYLRGLCAMRVVDVPIRKGDPRSPTRPMYEKKTTSHVNDPGDLEKMGCQMHHHYRLQHLRRGLQTEESFDPMEDAEPTPESTGKDYLLK